MYFWLFLTKPVGVNEHLGGWEAPGGLKLPTPPTNRALILILSDLLSTITIISTQIFYLNLFACDN